jgi:hypothetical protein
MKYINKELIMRKILIINLKLFSFSSNPINLINPISPHSVIDSNNNDNSTSNRQTPTKEQHEKYFDF